MRTLLLGLGLILLATTIGCAASPAKDSTTISEWGKLSRPRF